MGFTASANGPRNGRTGSNNPQSCLADNVLDRPDSTSLVGPDAKILLLRPRFLPPFAAPTPFSAVPVRARAETAALRPVNRSLQYAAWPSLAPFSMGPVVELLVPNQNMRSDGNKQHTSQPTLPRPFDSTVNLHTCRIALGPRQTVPGLDLEDIATGHIGILRRA